MRLNIIKKLKKLAVCSSNAVWRRGLYHGVGAAIEHDAYFKHFNFRTIVDVGANAGQFSLVMKKNFPRANIYSFEPLPKPFKKFLSVFENDSNVKVFNSAIGPHVTDTEIHVSGRDDSSSLLPISDLQNQIFPGTAAVRTEKILMGPLSEYLSEDQIKGPSLLKLDVQGFELDALKGCLVFIRTFDMVYCECSFVELYVGQALACEVISYMSECGFRLEGLQNVAYDHEGKTVQADCIFINNLGVYQS
jgi:FkbM family methyltransferase